MRHSTWSWCHFRSPTERQPSDGPHLFSPEVILLATGSDTPVLTMITSRGNIPWPLDVPITDGPSAGLMAPSVVRMKLFTLDHRLILRKAGDLARVDRRAVLDSLKQLLVAKT